MLRTTPWLLVLVACDKLGNDEAPYCEDTPTAVSFDEVTDLGFSAADAFARLPATEAQVLTWVDASVTDLALGFESLGTARFVTSVAVYPEGVTPAIAVECDDRVEVDLAWTFATSDGAFDETLDGALRATAVDAGTLDQPLVLDGLVGSFDLDDWVDGVAYDEAKAWIRVVAGDGETSGEVVGQISGEEDCVGDECTAWAQAVDVGTWGVPTR